MAGSDGVNIGPLERTLSVALGAVAGVVALRRRTPLTGGLLAGLGAYLAYRGITGRSRLYRALGITGSQVGQTIGACSQLTVLRPRGEVYRYLEDHSNSARFSRYITGAQPLGEGRWRLTVRPPVGKELELEVVQTVAEGERHLAWCTTEDSNFAAALEIRLAESPSGTEIHADLWLEPGSHPLVTAALRGAEDSRAFRRAGLTPSEVLEQELRRLRQLLETGETSTTSGQSAGGRRARRARGSRPALAAIGRGNGR